MNLTPNFIHIIYPFKNSLDYSQTTLTNQATDQATGQVTMQAEKALQFCIELRSRNDIQSFLDPKNRDYFRKDIMNLLKQDTQVPGTLLNIQHPQKHTSTLRYHRDKAPALSCVTHTIPK